MKEKASTRNTRQSDDASRHDTVGWLVVASILLAMVFAPFGCVSAEEEPVWEIPLTTWYDKASLKRQVFEFPNLHECYQFQIFLKESMEHARQIDNKFGAIVGECNEQQ